MMAMSPTMENALLWLADRHGIGSHRLGAYPAWRNERTTWRALESRGLVETHVSGTVGRQLTDTGRIEVDRILAERGLTLSPRTEVVR